MMPVPWGQGGLICSYLWCLGPSLHRVCPEESCLEQQKAETGKELAVTLDDWCSSSFLGPLFYNAVYRCTC